MKAIKINELSEKAREQVREEFRRRPARRRTTPLREVATAGQADDGRQPGGGIRSVVAGGVSGAVADMERVAGHVALGAEAGTGYDGRVDIRIVERRRRLTDYGGSSHKYVVDALVSCGVLPDDRPEVVRRIGHEQERIQDGAEEQTVIEIVGVVD